MEPKEEADVLSVDGDGQWANSSDVGGLDELEDGGGEIEGVAWVGGEYKVQA